MVKKIESKIRDLDSKGIDMSILEEAKRINNSIGMLFIKGYDSKDISYLENILKNVMRKKFSIIFSEFDDSIIDKMLSSYLFGTFYIPYDIEILGDAVFVRCYVINDFGEISNDRIYSLNNGLVDINNYEHFNININKSDYESEEYEEYFDSKEVRMKIVDFLCNSINQICGKDLVTPTYREYDTFHDGIDVSYGYKIAINYRFHEICKAMYENRVIIINLSVIEKNKYIYYYKIEQSMNGVIPSWNVINSYTETCSMSKILKK